MSSKRLVLRNTKKKPEFIHRLIEIEPVTGAYGIGGELGVPFTTNRLHGGLNALGRRKRPMGSCMRT